jgi:hypothetical protein
MDEPSIRFEDNATLASHNVSELLQMIRDKKEPKNAIFNSQHRAKDFISELQSNGQIKKCYHIEIGYGYFDRFYPKCNKKSFDQEYNAGTAKLTIDGCPKNCYFYTPYWQKRVRNFFSRLVIIWLKNLFQFLGTAVIGFGKWFSQLSKNVQLIIVICLLIYVSAPFAEKIVNFVGKIVSTANSAN